MIEKNTFYSIEDLMSIKNTNNYLLEIKEATSENSSCSTRCMISSDPEFILQTFEKEIKERCCWDKNDPYKLCLDEDYFVHNERSRSLGFTCNFKGNYRFDNFYSAYIYSDKRNYELKKKFKAIMEKYNN